MCVRSAQIAHHIEVSVDAVSSVRAMGADRSSQRADPSHEVGVPCGNAVGEAAAAAAAERGFRFVMVSNDATMFATAARDVRAAVDQCRGDRA